MPWGCCENKKMNLYTQGKLWGEDHFEEFSWDEPQFLGRGFIPGEAPGLGLDTSWEHCENKKMNLYTQGSPGFGPWYALGTLCEQEDEPVHTGMPWGEDHVGEFPGISHGF